MRFGSALRANMLNDFKGKAVLITGGTKGIGLATGLAFGQQGAHVTLTNKWGSADEDDIRDQFLRRKAPVPSIVEADAGSNEDTKALLQELKKKHERVEVLISNVAFAQVV